MTDTLEGGLIDPLAEEYLWMSPYVYTSNNPIRFIDPDGRELLPVQGSTPNFRKKLALTYAFMVAKGTADLLTAINNHEGTIYIAETSGDSMFSPSTSTILWNPEMGVMTTEGINLSPATVLNHEADHALRELVDPQNKAIDKATFDEVYGNKEERRVITGSEQETSENQVTRKNHSGYPYSAKNPISTEDKNTIVVTPNTNKK